MPQIFRQKFLLNGGSINMAVDGSVTPVDFEINFIEKNIDIRKIEIYILSKGDIRDYDNQFIGIDGALTNGLSLGLQAQGLSFLTPVIKSTSDLIREFDDTGLIQQGQRGRDGFFRGDIAIPQKSLILSANRGDFFNMQIQDDLSELDFMSISIVTVVQD